jgi:hypothetical protein
MESLRALNHELGIKGLARREQYRKLLVKKAYCRAVLPDRTLREEIRAYIISEFLSHPNLAVFSGFYIPLPEIER